MSVAHWNHIYPNFIMRYITKPATAGIIIRLYGHNQQFSIQVIILVGILGNA